MHRIIAFKLHQIASINVNLLKIEMYKYFRKRTQGISTRTRNLINTTLKRLSVLENIRQLQTRIIGLPIA